MVKKYLIISFFLIFGMNSFGQDLISGKYYNFFGSKLMLNLDSTYYYYYHFDLGSSWSIGNWVNKFDTVILNPILVYDTITYKESDSLVLSNNLRSERISPEKFVGLLLTSKGQNRTPSTRRLLYKDGKLYDFNSNGNIKTHKIYCPYRQKKFKPFYQKDNFISGEYIVDFKTDGHENYKLIFDGVNYKKYTEIDTIEGELIWISDNIFILNDKVEIEQNKVGLEKLLNDSFGSYCFEISSISGKGFNFRTTYTGQLHITVSEGTMIKK